MIPLQQYAVKLVIIAAFGAVMTSAGWQLHTWKVAEDMLKLERELSDAKDENDQLKTKLGVQHAEDQKRNDSLAADLRSLRVRLPKGCVKPNTTSGSTDEAPGSGVVPDAPQAALDEFKRGVDALAKDADDMAASCRVVVEWSKEQGALR